MRRAAAGCFRGLIFGLLLSLCSAAWGQTNVSYGPEAFQTLSLWKPAGAGPFPIALYMHGGAFVGGDRARIPRQLLHTLLDAGFAVASVEYGLRENARFPGAMMDSARALQFLRSRAAGLDLDRSKVVVTGNSAGAGIALWIAFHPDLANPADKDPVLRESTRVTAAAVLNAQTTYTPSEITRIFGARRYPGFLRTLFGVSREDLASPERQKDFDKASPLAFYTADDPPVYMVYSKEAPVDPQRPKSFIHNSRFADPLKALSKSFGSDVEVEVVSGEGLPAAYRDLTTFAARHIKGVK